MINIEALSKEARNDPRFLFESYLNEQEKLSGNAWRLLLEKNHDGSYKNGSVELHWKAWVKAWELAKRSGRSKPMQEQEKEPNDIEAWNKAARNNPRCIFEHQIGMLDELSLYESRFVFRKDSDGEYKDIVTRARWSSWKRGWETAKLADCSKPMSADVVKEMLHRLDVSMSEITLAKNTLSSVSGILKHDQEKLLLAVGNAFDYSSVALCSAIKNVVDMLAKAGDSGQKENAL